MPEALQAAVHIAFADAIRHAPARAAAAKPHDEPGLAMRAAVARREDAECPVVAMDARQAVFAEGEARRPHERAIAEHPEFSASQGGLEFAERHVAPDYAFDRRVNQTQGWALLET